MTVEVSEDFLYYVAALERAVLADLDTLEAMQRRIATGILNVFNDRSGDADPSASRG